VRKVAISLGVGFLLLAAVVVTRTVSLSSRQVEVDPAPRTLIDAGAAAERLAAALRFRTVSSQEASGFDGDELDGLRHFLESTFPGVHANLEREVIGDYSLLYRWPGRRPGSKPILLMAHLDVVPVEADAEQRWSHPPFAGVIADGFIWGRGALDDKASALALFESVERLLGEGFRPARTVYLAFGHDEEVGGREGAVAIAERLDAERVRFEYVLDEGGSIAEGLVPGVGESVAMIGIAEKGYVSLELGVEAAGGHSSMPPESTAVGVLSRAIARLESNPMPARIGVGLGPSLSYLAPEMSFTRRLVLANLWLFGWLLERPLARNPPTNAAIRTTTAATMFRSGVKENVLPRAARAVVNFRILPGDDIAEVIEHVGRTVDDPRVSVRALQFASQPSPISSTESAAFRGLAATIRQVFPAVLVAPSLVLGATDSRHYAPLSDGVYRFVPLWLEQEDLDRIHGTNERIGVERYADMIRFYSLLIRNSAA
jgi:carboxypeptidase PM20D1